MTEQSDRASPSAGSGRGASDSPDINSTRMSFGDHLEELRSHLIKALIGVAICAGLSLYFAGDLLSVLLQPALVVLEAHGQPANIQILSPPDSFLIYLKIGLLCGLIISMPWVLHQVWLFVASGLYAHERRFVRRFAPVSIMLFLGGVLFMYFIVLPIVLNFFVVFSLKIPMPDLRPNWVQRWFVPDDAATTQPAAGRPGPSIPLVSGTPADAEPGTVWVDTKANRLAIQTPDGVLSVRMEGTADAAPVNSQFGLNFYVSFILSLALAFGLAFEVPVLVVFLVLTDIVSVKALSSSRRYVIFGTTIAAAVLTPPDVVSQILLAIPVILLFEGGLFVGRMIERGREKERR